MRKALDAERIKKPDFSFTKDGVYPGRAGHWVMASAILQQAFAAKLEKIPDAEYFFPAGGDEIRKQVYKRMKIRLDARMAQITHLRPGVPGGPNTKPGLTVADASTQAEELTKGLQLLRTGSAPAKTIQ